MHVLQRRKESTVSALLATITTLAIATSTLAEDTKPPAEETKPPYSLTGNLGFVSDYRFRGISQTHKKPAVQGGFDFVHDSGFFVGTWASNVTSNLFANGNMEWDFYGGYNWKLNDDFTLSFSLIHYFYPNAKTSTTGPSKKFDTTEFAFGGSWKWLNAKYSHTITDYFGVTGSDGGLLPFNADSGVSDSPNGNSKGSGYLELNATYPLIDKLSLVGHLGRQKVRHYGNLDYTDWKLGATYDLNGFVFGLAYADTNAKKAYYKSGPTGDVKEIAKGTIVLSVIKSF